MHANYFLTEDDFDLLVIEGADAARFLQGQLTCDAQALPIPGFTYGASLTNKGRIVTTFIMIRRQTDFLLIFNKGLGALFKAQLARFLPFFKCLITEPDKLSLLVLVGKNSQQLPQKLQGEQVSVGSALEARGIIAANLSQAALPCSILVAPQDLLPMETVESLPHGDSQHWQASNANAGFYPFSLEDSELFSPQELALDQHGFVSFEKGCYTGQEIVARMHYRGKPKKHLIRLEFESAELSLTELEGLEFTCVEGPCSGKLIKILPLGNCQYLGLGFLPLGTSLNPADFQIERSKILTVGVM